MNRLLLNKLFLLILLLGISSSIYSQHGSANLSSKRSVKKYLKGDWYQAYLIDSENYSIEETDKYTFSFARFKYYGSWYRLHVRSSAEIMKIELVNDTVQIVLSELLGGDYIYKIKTLNKKELVLVNNKGKELIYFRE